MSSDLEKTNLEAHVELCMMRNDRLREKLEVLELKIKNLEIDLDKLEEKADGSLKEILDLILSSNKEKFKALLAPAATVFAAIVTMIGYLIVNYKHLFS